MTGKQRLRPLVLFIAAVTVLVTFGAGLGNRRDPEQDRSGSSPAVAPGAIGAGPLGLFDTRLQSDIEPGRGEPSPHHHGLSSRAVLLRAQESWAWALTTPFEHAGHPERNGQVCLRGPPVLSV